VVETNGQALVECLRMIPGQRHVCIEEAADLPQSCSKRPLDTVLLCNAAVRIVHTSKTRAGRRACTIFTPERPGPAVAPPLPHRPRGRRHPGEVTVVVGQRRRANAVDNY
jgi:hypothetical protein